MTADHDSSELGAVEDAVVALLSVGGFSLQRGWDCLERLKANGLIDPATTVKLGEGEVVRRLGASGYDRGAVVTTMMAKRLVKLHEAVQRGVLREACQRLRTGDEKEAERVLCQISGVGPAVFKNFVVLFSKGSKK